MNKNLHNRWMTTNLHFPSWDEKTVANLQLRSLQLLGPTVGASSCDHQEQMNRWVFVHTLLVLHFSFVMTNDEERVAWYVIQYIDDIIRPILRMEAGRVLSDSETRLNPRCRWSTFLCHSRVPFHVRPPWQTLLLHSWWSAKTWITTWHCSFRGKRRGSGLPFNCCCRGRRGGGSGLSTTCQRPPLCPPERDNLCFAWSWSMN